MKTYYIIHNIHYARIATITFALKDSHAELIAVQGVAVFDMTETEKAQAENHLAAYLFRVQGADYEQAADYLCQALPED